MNSRTYMTLGFSILAISLTGAVRIYGQQSEAGSCEIRQKQMDDMVARGDKEMGFDHMKTTHHFLLASDGGTIQVEANNPDDKESRAQIRQHLRHTAMMFAAGNFNAPMIIHGQTPPGTERMQQLKTDIAYQFKETPRGALVRIATPNPNALQAIHDFLRFQIKEHLTGDPLEIAPQR